MNPINPRIFHLVFALVVCLLASIVPYWAVYMLLVAGFFLFDQFYEGVLAGFFLDIFYGSYSMFPTTAGALILLLALPFIKRRLVFWPSIRF